MILFEKYRYGNRKYRIDKCLVLSTNMIDDQYTSVEPYDVSIIPRILRLFGTHIDGYAREHRGHRRECVPELSHIQGLNLHTTRVETSAYRHDHVIGYVECMETMTFLQNRGFNGKHIQSRKSLGHTVSCHLQIGFLHRPYSGQ